MRHHHVQNKKNERAGSARNQLERLTDWRRIFHSDESKKLSFVWLGVPCKQDDPRSKKIFLYLSFVSCLDTFASLFSNEHDFRRTKASGCCSNSLFSLFVDVGGAWNSVSA
jgi:hypothetical protein